MMSALKTTEPDSRAQERNHFLRTRGWPPGCASMLAADASFRSYCRVSDNNRSAVLMDAPPPLEDVQPFLQVAAHLRQLGLSAPEILDADEQRGFVLLEDFGDDTYSRLLDTGDDPYRLYGLATDTLIALHHNSSAADIALPAYTDLRLIEEATLLTDWYLPAVQGRAVDAGTRAAYVDIWRALLAQLDRDHPTLVLRDFHVDNLMLLPNRPGIRACGLLDFQDAVIGPTAYDLVSLLEDARRDVPEALSQTMLKRYLAGCAEPDAAALRRDMLILGAQRHCKVAGIFMRLFVRDGKPGYLGHLSRVMRLLDANVRQPEMAPLKRWLDTQLPAPPPAPHTLDRRRLAELCQSRGDAGTLAGFRANGNP